MNVVKFKTSLLTASILFAACWLPAQAQLDFFKKITEPEKAPQEAAIEIRSQLEIWKKEVAEELSDLSKYQTPESLPAGITQADLDNRRRVLERTQLAIKRHFDAFQSTKENQLALKEAQTKLADWQGYGDEIPTSILALDELKNRKQTVIEKMTADRSSLDIFERTFNEWLAESKKSAANISDAQSNGENPSAVWALDAEREKQRLLFIQSSALQQSISALKISIQTSEVESNLLDRKIQETSQTVSLSEQDLKQIKTASEDRQKEIHDEIEALRKRQRKAATEETEALASLDNIKAEGNVDPAALELAEISFEVAQARVNALQQMISSLESFVQIESFIPEAYQYRKELLNSKASSSAHKSALNSLKSLQQRLTAWEVVANNELKSVAAAIGNEQARATAFAADDPRLAALNQHRAILWERQTLVQRLAQSISTQLRTLDQWLASYQSDHQAPWHSEITSLVSRLWDATQRLWNIPVNQYEQTIEKDGQRIVQIRNVTLGAILTALILFVIAYLIAAFICRRIQQTLVRRDIIGENQARTLRNWIMLLVALLLALSTLSWLNIPLTIFAFLAGALAIGVGFGTQTMIKNFISGIILLFERKVRVGDIVEVDGILGVVSEINTRSSNIRGFNGIENLIPNSLFLENRVVNWTLENRFLRREINVGVAYGSPVQEVTKLLIEAAERHGLILKNPLPFATFSNFGDNSLDFILYFWIELNDKTNGLVVDSDLRIMIEKRFNEVGISVPFPQRDIHFDASKPLQVQLHSDEVQK